MLSLVRYTSLVHFSIATILVVSAGCGDSSVADDDTPGAGCGNGVIQTGEQCDDGNLEDGDGCSSSCRVEPSTQEAPKCGDGIVDPGEDCDDGNEEDGDECSSTCELTACGNGLLEKGEQCDDGNVEDGDGCTSDCRSEALLNCGDGVVDEGETCDDGNTENGDGCSAICEDENRSNCGNGRLEGMEQCDDGNTESGDGCSSSCTIEGDDNCNNAVIEEGEECDGESDTCNMCVIVGECRECESALTCPTGQSGDEVFDECFNGEGVATAGPRANLPKSVLCARVMECFRRTGCASGEGGATACYCGEGVNQLDCASGMASGECIDDMAAAAESTEFFEIATRFQNSFFALGRAVSLLNCDRRGTLFGNPDTVGACADACF